MDCDEDRKPTVAEKQALDAQIDPGSPSCTTKRVKPALKKGKHGGKQKKALKWDEVAIEEHDQLRGTRMKIEEPNTPYCHYDSGQESDDSRRPKSPVDQKDTLSWDTLQNRLDSVAAVREAYPSSPSSHGGDYSDEEQKRDEMRKLEFKEHRKRHYNEMELVRRFRSEHPEGCLDDGGDADVEDM